VGLLDVGGDGGGRVGGHVVLAWKRGGGWAVGRGGT
jgi:hypothetical protein